MSAAPRAFPLQWPDGWPRTKEPQKGAYRTSLAGALKNLRLEVRLLAGPEAADALVLSSNVTLGREDPADPGVVAFFPYEGEGVAIPCDRWSSVPANVQAIALTIESMRAIERHGAKHMVKAMFRGFLALPGPGADWRTVLEDPATWEQAEAAYRRLAREAHPDRQGGSNARMAALNAARDAARAALGPSP